MDRCETPTVEGNLFLPILFIRGKFSERGLDENSNGGGGWDFCGCRLLVTEETVLTATQVREKKGND
jgi:hypothetical protein